MHACALISDAEFGSALNIETLVAAAERRETPIEVTYIFSGSLTQVISFLFFFSFLF